MQPSAVHHRPGRQRQSRAELEAQVRAQAQQLHRLASQLTRAEQRERRRLGRVLHDHLQQLLVAAKLGLGALAGDEREPETLKQLNELIDEAIETTRNLAAELDPPVAHEAGLTAALEWLASWMRETHGLRVDVRADSPATTDRQEIQVFLFESVRELLFNVVKHAGVPEASVEVAANGDGSVRVTVSDEGRGFDPAHDGHEPADGLGLFRIRERLVMLEGRMTIDAAPGDGTRITLVAP